MPELTSSVVWRHWPTRHDSFTLRRPTPLVCFFVVICFLKFLRSAPCVPAEVCWANSQSSLMRCSVSNLEPPWSDQPNDTAPRRRLNVSRNSTATMTAKRRTGKSSSSSSCESIALVLQPGNDLSRISDVDSSALWEEATQIFNKSLVGDPEREKRRRAVAHLGDAMHRGDWQKKKKQQAALRKQHRPSPSMRARGSLLRAPYLRARGDRQKRNNGSDKCRSTVDAGVMPTNFNPASENLPIIRSLPVSCMDTSAKARVSSSDGRVKIVRGATANSLQRQKIAMATLIPIGGLLAAATVLVAARAATKVDRSPTANTESEDPSGSSADLNPAGLSRFPEVVWRQDNQAIGEVAMDARTDKQIGDAALHAAVQNHLDAEVTPPKEFTTELTHACPWFGAGFCAMGLSQVVTTYISAFLQTWFRNMCAC
eukprot:GHVT01075511.1.p1 GENE.GHVT01075511.1~~GHVT01075511.1.p1  ORF type:complete len:427 (-),score=29.24 GHVT01075511.1:79-1359(-)